MACLDEGVVQGFLTGSLDGPQVVRVDAHLGTCSECRALVAKAGAVGSSGARGVRTPTLAAASREIACAPGDVLCGRYRLLRRLGSGGMGDVYEAEDAELRTRVALKTLRPWLAAEDALVRRLGREVMLGRKVIHPSVCRIFDLHVHTPPPSGEGAEHAESRIVFLTMEVVTGETLGARIRLGGALPLHDTLSIAWQMASALDAVHDAGIVHRDFKSDNVMLVPLESGASRAVLMDFGLARLVSSALEAPTSSLVGTPLYMAPEQLLGGEVTPAADVYAFGVVLHEMLSGVLPLRPLVPQRLEASIPDARCRAVIARCLAERPADRFQRARDVAEALEGKTIEPTPRARRRRALAVLVALAATLAITTGALFAARLLAPHRSTQRPSVAVIAAPDALGGDVASGGAVLALVELLQAHLALGEKVRVASPQVVAQAARALPAEHASTLVAGDAVRLGAATASGYVVSAALVPLPEAGRRRATLVVYDGARGTTLLRLQDDDAADLATVASRFGARIRALLGLPTLKAEDDDVRMAVPADAEAAKAYGVGLLQLRLYDGRGARQTLEHVVALAPDFAPAHGALAQALHFLREEKLARDEAERAFQLSGPLSREERLRVEGYYRLRANDWPRAIEVYRTLFTYFPDEPDYALRLADALTRGNRATEALDLLDGLLRRPDLEKNAMARYGRASALERLGRWGETATAADMAATLARAQQLPLIGADADMLASEALEHVGDHAAATAAEARAADTFAAQHDPRGLQWVMTRRLERAAFAQDLPEVERLGAEVLAVMREAGDTLQEARTLGTMASAGVNGGDLHAARLRYEQAVKIYQTLDDEESAANSLNDLGIVQRYLGNLEEARRDIAQGGLVLRKVHAPAYLAQSLAELCAVDRVRGEVASARLACDEGASIADESGAEEAKEYVAESMAALVFEMGDAARVRQIVDGLPKAAGDPPPFARLMAARLALEDGDFDAAVSAAQAAREGYAADREVFFVADADTVAGEALAALHRPLEAEAALSRAREVAERSGSALVASGVSLASARALRASGRVAEANRAAAECARTAAAHGFTVIELDARIDEAAATRARPALRALATTARAKGAMRLAARAERAAR